MTAAHEVGYLFQSLILIGVHPEKDQCIGHSLVSVLSGGKSARKEAVTTYNGAQFGLYNEPIN